MREDPTFPLGTATADDAAADVAAAAVANTEAEISSLSVNDKSSSNRPRSNSIQRPEVKYEAKDFSMAEEKDIIKQRKLSTRRRISPWLKRKI